MTGVPRDDCLRVATWNLWWHFGPWEERQAAIVAAMREADADVWCLQEVYRDRTGADQAGDLAAALGGYHVAYATGFDLDEFDTTIGNAVLSRWPITDTAVRVLPAPGGLDELRVALRAEVATPRGPVEVFVTHLNYRLDQSDVRQAQVRDLCTWIDETAERRSYPPVLCGDLNADPEAEEIRMLTGLTTVPVPRLVFIDAWRAAGPDPGPGWTWDNRNPFAALDHEPDRRIDYVLVGYPRDGGRGQAVAARRIGTAPVDGVWPSDHCGVVVDLRA